MEKKRKGLFERLMDFWREKIHMVGEDRIGFWYEKESLEEHFAEMGAVADISRKEVQKNFSFEMEEKQQRVQEMFSAEKEEKPQKKKESVFVESMQMFKENEEAEKSRNAQVLLWEEPEMEKEKRERVTIDVQEAKAKKERIVPVVREEKTTESFAEEKEGDWERPARIEQQKNVEIDVEKLMQQITKKLWEERESCGRRLR